MTTSNEVCYWCCLVWPHISRINGDLLVFVYVRECVWMQKTHRGPRVGCIFAPLMFFNPHRLSIELALVVSDKVSLLFLLYSTVWHGFLYARQVSIDCETLLYNAWSLWFGESGVCCGYEWSRVVCREWLVYSLVNWPNSFLQRSQWLKEMVWPRGESP